ncbi:hypothetical protein ACIF8T_07830 [Streptomyces sp. NPDC085946]|uniref:hypothetical protein n=1 Tax=Streptomyces sp. NPDC085946 TaxID=3365744 RepID=UPI0037D541F1
MSEGSDARRDARDRHEPLDRHEPAGPDGQRPERPGPDGQEPKQSHAGNGTVNHGPDEMSPEGLGSDELALRRLLQQAVEEVEPRDGTLEYLRRAVPARRARKRQAVVGMAAAALFVGTAIPALVHVSNATGPDANPAAIGHTSEAQGGTGQGKDPDGGPSSSGGASGKPEDKQKDEKKKDGKGKETGTGSGTSQGTGPSSSSVAGVPACTAAHLGPAVASIGAPDSTGAVYGSFRVTNVSAGDCTVGGPGGVSAFAQGAADPARVGSARHAAGDAAAGLPDPSLESAPLTLAAGAAYEVRFAWVPTETCPTTGGSTGSDGGTGVPSPDPTPTQEPATTTGATSTGTDTGTTTQLVTEDVVADGSVAVSYTPETGAGSATTVVSNACAGTVYWTGMLAGA